ncbi:Uncharacterised protein [uncultured Anaerotruncus sp.]|uniref:Uncharacterized protein n=1 Tax=uncultured Anaerotruncus sp. TaxID=905011 RepID=A0A6N2R426_9FIRM|nr:MAG TPA: Transcription initiation factor IIE, alpha FINGER, Transcription [Caudoviricetes sp.]
MAKEYIEREAFREYAMEMTESTEIQFDMCYPYWQFSKAIKEMPAADVAPMVHGRWIWANDGYLRCSNCHQKAPVMTQYQDEPMTVATDYCPNCGCRMDLEG